MRRIFLFAMLTAILFTMPGCTTQELKNNTPSSEQQRVAQNSRYFEQINKAEQLWKSKDVRNYRLKLSFYENFGGIHNTERIVEVHEGKIISSACPSDNCPVFVLRNIQTIGDLFEMAKGSTLIAEVGSINECLKDIAFDTTYGFPTNISIDCPQQSDEENSIKVISFEVLK